MPQFNGFSSGKLSFTPIPEPFFNELLPRINHIGELKLTLYILWQIDKQSEEIRFVSINDILNDKLFMLGMGQTDKAARKAVDDAIKRAVERGTILEAKYLLGSDEVEIFFLNSPKGRTAWQALRRGEWQPDQPQRPAIELTPEKPNIFRLYEEHIGPLTPMTAEILKDAEDTYPEHWIEQAIRLAVKSNVRRWNYIEAILKRWQEGRKDDQETGQDSEEDRRRRYLEGKYADFIE